MRTTCIALTLAAALAAAGCAPGEDRLEEARRSASDMLAQLGFSDVAFGPSSFEEERIEFSGVRARTGKGVTLFLDKLVFDGAEDGRGSSFWPRLGRFEVNGWVLYAGDDPAPKGLKAKRVTGERLVVDIGTDATIIAEAFEIDDWDDTHPDGFRYSGYRVSGAAVDLATDRLLEVRQAETRVRDWQASFPLNSRMRAEGKLAVPTTGIYAFLKDFSGPMTPFSLDLSGEGNLSSGRASLEGSFSAGNLGSLSLSVKADGIGRSLFEALADVGRAEGGGPMAAAATTREEKRKAAARLHAAVSKVRLSSLRLDGKGLGWFGAAMDGLFGGREAFANFLLPHVDRSFGPGERTDAENASLGALMLFLFDPSSFTLVLEPNEPFAFLRSTDWYKDPRSGPLREMGFGFRNATGG